MADKGKIKQSIKDLQRIKTWQLIVLLVIVGFVSATFLRLNNIGMVERREAVLSADKQGDEGVTIQRLYDLQRHVSSHMNTDLGRGVYLESSFTRDVQNWQSTQYGASNPNGNIFDKAQAICAPRFKTYSAAYVQCTTSELSKFPAAADPASDTSKPRQEAYIHAFSSPFWSPDFAGWSVVAFAIILVLIVVRIVSLAVLGLLLRKHYKSI